MEHFYSQSVPSKQTIMAMSTTMVTLRAKMICFCFCFWLLSCLPMVMTVPMSHSEMKAELFCLQCNDAKLAIVGMFWTFRNYSPMSLFFCSVLHNFDSPWQCHLPVSQLSPIYTYSICYTFLSLSLGFINIYKSDNVYMGLNWQGSMGNFKSCCTRAGSKDVLYVQIRTSSNTHR